MSRVAERRENPYPRHRGFGLRYQNAKRALERFGRDQGRSPDSRAFDRCFENSDGDAVVWALMHDALTTNNTVLANGIRGLGDQTWQQWLELYEMPKRDAPKQTPLGFGLWASETNGNPRSRSRRR